MKAGLVWLCVAAWVVSGCGLSPDALRQHVSPQTEAPNAPNAPKTPIAPQATTQAQRSAGDGSEGRLSGYHFMSRATQALQDDDTQNPAFLWVADGQRQFEAQCTGCHSASALSDAATRYPAFDDATQRPLTLHQRIAQCHSQRSTSATQPQTAQASKPASGAPARNPTETSRQTVLALETYLGFQARGKPIPARPDPRLRPWWQQGQALWQQRMGQLDLSCADCHDRLAGQRLAGSTIPQAHPTGYPVYRLEWQTLDGLPRRLRGCLSGIRAEPFAPEATEWVALEIYLKSRAAGMPLDAPAVRP